METLKFNSNELKEVISKGEKLGDGFFSEVHLCDSRTLKVEHRFVDLLRSNNDPDFAFSERYKWHETDKKMEDVIAGIGDFANLKLIGFYDSIKDKITLTRLPVGVIEVNGIVGSKEITAYPGIILPYFDGYKELISIINEEDFNLKKVNDLLRKILLAMKELESYQISHEDLHLGNILYKGEDVQIIDLDGSKIKWGPKFKDAKEMYHFFSQEVIKRLYEKLYEKINHLTKEELKNLKDDLDKTCALIESYSDAIKSLDELEEKTQKLH